MRESPHIARDHGNATLRALRGIGKVHRVWKAHQVFNALASVNPFGFAAQCLLQAYVGGFVLGDGGRITGSDLLRGLQLPKCAKPAARVIKNVGGVGMSSNFSR